MDGDSHAWSKPVPNEKKEPFWAREFRAKFLRKRSFRMTVDDAAEMLGTSKRTLTRWLSGEGELPVTKAALISDLLGMPMDRLFRSSEISDTDPAIAQCIARWRKTPLGVTLIAHGVTPRILATGGVDPMALFNRLEHSSYTTDNVVRSSGDTRYRDPED